MKFLAFLAVASVLVCANQAAADNKTKSDDHKEGPVVMKNSEATHQEPKDGQHGGPAKDGKHGGPEGALHGPWGKQPHERSPSEFSIAVGKCLGKDFSKGPINLYFHTPKNAIDNEVDRMFEKIINEENGDGKRGNMTGRNKTDDSNSASHEEGNFWRRGRDHMKIQLSGAQKDKLKELVKSKNADLRKLFSAKLACHIAGVVDEVLEGLPSAKTYVGVGYSDHWQYISGTAKVKGNLVEYYDKLRQLSEKLGINFTQWSHPFNFNDAPHVGNMSGNFSDGSHHGEPMQGNFSGIQGSKGFGGPVGPHMPRSDLAKNVALVFLRQALEESPAWELNNKSVALSKSPSYQVFFTSVDFESSIKGVINLIVDVGGNYSLGLGAAGKAVPNKARPLGQLLKPANVIVADPAESLKKLIPYIRARICQQSSK